LESGFLKVELYMSQGSDAIRLATGLLTLRELVVGNTAEGISKVMKSSITLNGYNNQFVGVVEFRCRMMTR
jgi:First C2 domain of RPGR-interacting protein 1